MFHYVLPLFALMSVVGLAAGPARAAEPTYGAERTYLVVKNRPTEFSVITKFDAERQMVWTFNEKDWGTWNIYWLTLTQNDAPEPTAKLVGRREIAGGGTDWEYVFRGSPVAAEPAEWMGGNHGNEKLVSLTILADGQEFDPRTDLGLNEARKFRSVKVREETRLIHPKMDGEVAAIERLYKFVPGGLRLHYKVEWLQEVYLDVAYMLMLPVSKSYGRHVQFTGDDRVVSFENSLKSNQFAGFAHSLEARTWGDKAPDLRMRAFLADYQAVDDYRYAGGRNAFVWDLTPTQVKLYFARYVFSGFHPITPGTRWEVQSGWDLEVVSEQ